MRQISMNLQILHEIIRPLFPVALLVCIGGCREERIINPIIPPSDTLDVLVNTSFELGGSPTLAGWTIVTDPAVEFSTDVPPEGGGWSVTVDATWTPPTAPAQVLTIVPTQDGTSIYRLTVWAKRNGVGGSAAILIKQSGTTLLSKSVFIQDSLWTAITILDTISTTLGDSIGVRLAGGISQLAGGTTYFDLCLLERFQE